MRTLNTKYRITTTSMKINGIRFTTNTIQLSTLTRVCANVWRMAQFKCKMLTWIGQSLKKQQSVLPTIDLNIPYFIQPTWFSVFIVAKFIAKHT